MKFLKSLKKTMLVISATYITVGVLMIMNKAETNDLVFQILAYGLALAGLLSIIRYFLINVKYRFKRDDFIVGILLIAIGAVIYLSKEDITYLVERILAIAMIVSGFHKIQDMFDTRAAGKSLVGLYLFGFTVCAGLGALTLFGVIKNPDVVYVLVGLGMCICGISDLVSNFFVAYAVVNYENTWAEKAKVNDAPEELQDRHNVEKIGEGEKPLE